MVELWKVEEDIRGRSPAAPVVAHQSRSTAVVADRETELPRIPWEVQIGRGEPLHIINANYPWALRSRPSRRDRLQHLSELKELVRNNPSNAVLQAQARARETLDACRNEGW